MATNGIPLRAFGKSGVRVSRPWPWAATIWAMTPDENIGQDFQPMSAAEMQSPPDRLKDEAADGRFEMYKVSLKYDNPEARITHEFHEFPLDMMCRNW